MNIPKESDRLYLQIREEDNGGNHFYLWKVYKCNDWNDQSDDSQGMKLTYL